jgi:hypothetical protein
LHELCPMPQIQIENHKQMALTVWAISRGTLGVWTRQHYWLARDMVITSVREDAAALTQRSCSLSSAVDAKGPTLAAPTLPRHPLTAALLWQQAVAAPPHPSSAVVDPAAVPQVLPLRPLFCFVFQTKRNSYIECPPSSLPILEEFCRIQVPERNDNNNKEY